MKKMKIETKDCEVNVNLIQVSEQILHDNGLELALTRHVNNLKDKYDLSSSTKCQVIISTINELMQKTDKVVESEDGYSIIYDYAMGLITHFFDDGQIYLNHLFAKNDDDKSIVKYLQTESKPVMNIAEQKSLKEACSALLEMCNGE